MSSSSSASPVGVDAADGLSDEERSQYAALTAGSPVQVRRTPGRGRGTFATAFIPKGTVVIEEAPLVAIQTSVNRSDCAACSRCLCFVGPLECQLELLARRQGLQTLSDARLAWRLPPQPPPPALPPIARCEWGCGEVYCGAVCRAAAEPAHRWLCVAQAQDDTDPLYQFKVHAIQANDSLLLCGSIIADILVRRQDSGCWGAAMKPYRQFVGGLWWDVAVAPEDACAEEFAATLRNLCTESASHLCAAFGPKIAALDAALPDGPCLQCGTECKQVADELLTRDFLANLVGILERNQHGLRVANPARGYFEALAASHPEGPPGEELALVLKEIDAAIHAEGCSDDGDDGAEAEEEDVEAACHSHGGGVGGEAVTEEAAESPSLAWADVDPVALFPPLDGQGMFTLASLMNHSCEPNITLEFPPTGPLRAQLVALRDLAPGTELLICYLGADAAADATVRATALRDYGFTCDCPRCTEGR